ncbi:hypothetical protein SAG0136_04855 [Streptococcus agalactiae LMG 14747]|uniref:Uncharacterized protein n=2 Tax=Streptococcus TaxID=1301 RepID=V6Z0T8_STRAG|nr:hypothetical protein SAG0136_04855 [Streptococcus agalactiae LMG 14747]SNV34113.1 Uncharacterised protein [Streptococcus acidominimus]
MTDDFMNWLGIAMITVQLIWAIATGWIPLAICIAIVLIVLLVLMKKTRK